MKPSLQLLADLVALPGPPGREGPVRDYLAAALDARALPYRIDAKGNLLVGSEMPRIVVTAHLDEIALMVSRIEEDGRLRVLPLGGAHIWKWGETAVEIWGAEEPVAGVVSLGSIHTICPQSMAERARAGVAPTWGDAWVITGLSAQELTDAGIYPGCRVTIARGHRALHPLAGGLIGGRFLDDRADVAAWLLALDLLAEQGGIPEDVLFAATVSEEVGGHGALYLLQGLRLQAQRPEVVVALEIGPSTPDGPLELSGRPVVWVSDGYAAADPRDLELLRLFDPQWIALTRGGSDASVSAAQGLCARPVTLAFAAENSHGFEVMHGDALESLAELTVAYLERAHAHPL